MRWLLGDGPIMHGWLAWPVGAELVDAVWMIYEDTVIDVSTLVLGEG